MKLCQADTCNNPVWGKGFCKNHQYLRPDFDNRTILQKGIAKAVIQKQLSSLKKLPENKEAAKKYDDKSSMLKIADGLVSEFVRRRDCDGNGNVICPCCHKTFNLEDKTADGKIIVALHFVDRDVYNLRFDESRNIRAGCCYCNLKQHLNPKGQEYKNFRELLVEELGEEEVAEMELEHRKINKITLEQLKNIIEHYGNETGR